jgi:hypothetical protein
MTNITKFYGVPGWAKKHRQLVDDIGPRHYVDGFSFGVSSGRASGYDFL